MTIEDRMADPGFTAAMNQTSAAINELREMGVPYSRAMEIVNRVYDIGRDRGLYLGLRNAGTPTVTS